MGAFILLATNKAINSDRVLQLLFAVFYGCGIQRMLMKRVKGITFGILAIKRKKKVKMITSSSLPLGHSKQVTRLHIIPSAASGRELGFHVGCRTTCSRFASFPL